MCKNGWVLIGLRYCKKEDYSLIAQWVSKEIAIFDSLESATEYVEKSRKNNPIHHWFPFRDNSLLGKYSYAKIEQYNKNELPLNPVIIDNG